MNQELEDRLLAVIDRERREGCTMADAGLIAPALRRWRSYERRYPKHKDRSHDHRARDLVKGFMALFPDHDYDPGCLKHLAESFAAILDPEVSEDPVVAHGPSPADCQVCGGLQFVVTGRVGHWEGRKGGGDMFGARCSECGTFWVGKVRGMNPLDLNWEIESAPWWDDV